MEGKRKAYRRGDTVNVRQVEKLAGLGLSMKNIAEVMDVSVRTLERHAAIDAAIQRGRACVNRSVVQALYDKAIGGSVPALIFWLCNRCPDQWRNTQHIPPAEFEIPPIAFIPARSTRVPEFTAKNDGEAGDTQGVPATEGAV